MTVPQLVLVLLYVGVFGGIGYSIGARKGEPLMAAVLGLCCGPLGWIIAGVSGGSRVKCPACRSLVPSDASICKHCRTPLHA